MVGKIVSYLTSYSRKVWKIVKYLTFCRETPHQKKKVIKNFDGIKKRTHTHRKWYYIYKMGPNHPLAPYIHTYMHINTYSFVIKRDVDQKFSIRFLNLYKNIIVKKNGKQFFFQPFQQRWVVYERPLVKTENNQIIPHFHKI